MTQPNPRGIRRPWWERNPASEAPPPPGVPGGSDAYQVMAQMLREWGLESLLPDLQRLLEDGHSQEQVSFLLQDTDAYKQRFAGNEARRSKGLPVLAPRDYLEVERSYHQILRSSGMPEGFYDDSSDFADWIGRDVSPVEIRDRVGLAVEAANSLDGETRQAFRDFYGVAETDLAAFYLDPDRAQPWLERVSKATRVGAAALRQGLQTSRGRAEELASLAGAGDADQLYGQVADLTATGGKLAELYGQEYGQTDAEEETFRGLASARRKRQKLSDREQAEFSGGSGVSRTSLSTGTRSGGY